MFISHASEDKDRFTVDFATRLRERGINAWIDQWEMLPGDSLIDKIFEEGIGNAQAVIVVISKHSVHKKWVREELNAAMVRKIDGLSKLIPVVLDDCTVPEVLKSTIWQKIGDTAHYDGELDRIVMAIFDQRVMKVNENCRHLASREKVTCRRPLPHQRSYPKEPLRG